MHVEHLMVSPSTAGPAPSSSALPLYLRQRKISGPGFRMGPGSAPSARQASPSRSRLRGGVWAGSGSGRAPEPLQRLHEAPSTAGKGEPRHEHRAVTIRAVGTARCRAHPCRNFFPCRHPRPAQRRLARLRRRQRAVGEQIDDPPVNFSLDLGLGITQGRLEARLALAGPSHHPRAPRLGLDPLDGLAIGYAALEEALEGDGADPDLAGQPGHAGRAHAVAKPVRQPPPGGAPWLQGDLGGRPGAPGLRRLELDRYPFDRRAGEGEDVVDRQESIERGFHRRVDIASPPLAAKAFS